MLLKKMLAVIVQLNEMVAERSEAILCMAIALLTRKNLFILGGTGQAKSCVINLFCKCITGAKLFTRLLTKQVDEESLFGRIDLKSYIDGKVRCAVCGHVMQRSRKYDPVFKCGTNRFTSHYACVGQAVSQADIELAVMESLKVYIDTMIEGEELMLETLRQAKDDKAAIENRIKAERQSLRLLEDSKTKIFTSMVSGEMTTEAFISKKEIINATIVKKNDLIEKLETRFTALTTRKAASEKALTKLYVFRDLEKLDKYSVDSLIDRILIHRDKNIEIVWNDRIG